jgi:predicted RNA-binding protein (virulence factor B family)
MNSSFTAGQFNALTIDSFSREGAIFDCDGTKILLPVKELKPEMNIGSELNVFVYKSDNDKYFATLKTPFAKAGEYAYLVINDVNKAGAFADMGIDKELLIPYNQQEFLPVAGHKCIVYVYVDKENGRLCGSTNLLNFIDKQECDLKTGDVVEVMITKFTDLGYNVIVNNLFAGLLYRNEVFRKLSVGERCRGYVKKMREDGKLDISLQKQGGALINASEMLILEKLKENSGTLYLSDNSSPREIAVALNISKKAFKKAIGGLYKAKKVTLHEDRITLI